MKGQETTSLLPVFSHAARVDYITTATAANTALVQLGQEPVLGLDTEWRPNYVTGQPENPTALVQLASPTRILLIHLSAMRRFPAQLFVLLNDEKVVKTGVGIQHDIQKLRRWSTPDAQLLPRSVIDLSTLARQAKPGAHPGKMSNPIALTKLVETYVGKKLEKPRKVIMSNWDTVPLTSKQQLYAANDAYSSLCVYLQLQSVLSTEVPIIDGADLEDSTSVSMKHSLPSEGNKRPLKKKKEIIEEA